MIQVQRFLPDVPCLFILLDRSLQVYRVFPDAFHLFNLVRHFMDLGNAHYHPRGRLAAHAPGTHMLLPPWCLPKEDTALRTA